MDFDILVKHLLVKESAYGPAASHKPWTPAPGNFVLFRNKRWWITGLNGYQAELRSEGREHLTVPTSVLGRDDAGITIGDIVKYKNKTWIVAKTPVTTADWHEHRHVDIAELGTETSMAPIAELTTISGRKPSL